MNKVGVFALAALCSLSACGGVVSLGDGPSDSGSRTPPGSFQSDAGIPSGGGSGSSGGNPSASSSGGNPSGSSSGGGSGSSSGGSGSTSSGGGSGSSSGGSGSTSSSGGSGSSSGSGSGSSSGSAPGCYAGTPFTAPTWKVPTALHQGACASADLTAFDACITDPAHCTSGNAACDACILTDVGAANYGPFVTQTSASGVTTLVETNWGGCQANIDGDTNSGSCGDQTDTWQACAAAECGTCGDINNPMTGGPTDDCLAFAADSDEACADETELLKCANEWYSDGGVPECTDPTSLIAVWCGN